MPLKYHPNIRAKALKLMEEGYTAEQVLEELANIYGEKNVPRQRETIYTWRKKEKEKVSNALNTVMRESNKQTMKQVEPETFIEDSEYTAEPDEKPFAPPSLTELLDRKVPKAKALRLLSEWDVAYASGRKLSTITLKNAADLFGEFPDMPYDVAMAIGSFEVRAKYFNAKDASDIADLVKRYRPWESGENRKAMMRVFRHWCETRFGKRQKQASKGILSRVIRGKGIGAKADSKPGQGWI